MNPKATLIIAIIFLTFLSGCSTAQKFKIMLPNSFIGMEEVVNGLYVDHEMSVSQRQELSTSIKAGKEKVKNIWGNVESKPDVYACSTETCFQSFGGSTNKANAVWGRMLLSPRALDPEMIAHEWSHNELYQRLDSFFAWRNIPQWFDDGIAVYVSGYEVHGDSEWAKIKRVALNPPSLMS
ncbi:MAG: hypothetical protein Q9N62_12390 [Ghiorsea sp.]|nr:hypothetical protein [Ghiorsea sp.]